jgi:hypothetical protein
LFLFRFQTQNQISCLAPIIKNASSITELIVFSISDMLRNCSCFMNVLHRVFGIWTQWMNTADMETCHWILSGASLVHSISPYFPKICHSLFAYLMRLFQLYNLCWNLEEFEMKQSCSQGITFEVLLVMSTIANTVTVWNFEVIPSKQNVYRICS